MTQRLWQEVLYTAIEDALIGSNDSGTSEQAKRSATYRARSYLTKPNADFNQVCSLAGLDPNAVRDAMRKRLSKAPSIDELFDDTSARSSKKNPHLSYLGQTLTIQQWADRTGLPKSTISSRLKLDWTVERTLSEPLRRGVRPNPRGSLGTGGGTRAQESTNITSQEKAA